MYDIFNQNLLTTLSMQNGGMVLLWQKVSLNADFCFIFYKYQYYRYQWWTMIVSYLVVRRYSVTDYCSIMISNFDCLTVKNYWANLWSSDQQSPLQYYNYYSSNCCNSHYFLSVLGNISVGRRFEFFTIWRWF